MAERGASGTLAIQGNLAQHIDAAQLWRYVDDFCILEPMLQERATQAAWPTSWHVVARYKNGDLVSGTSPGVPGGARAQTQAGVDVPVMLNEAFLTQAYGSYKPGRLLVMADITIQQFQQLVGQTGQQTQGQGQRAS